MPTPLPGDDIRATARLAHEATRLLEAAIGANDAAGARRALEAGALPEQAVFRTKKGNATTSALAKALSHKPCDLRLVALLMEFDAPMPAAGPGAVLQAALRHDQVEAIGVLCQRIKPRDADWIEALGRPLATFRALDDRVRMSRTKHLGKKSGTGHPPLFLVRDIEVLEYLLDTGAQATQTPGSNQGLSGADWYGRTAIFELTARAGERSRAGYSTSLAPLVRALQARGVPLQRLDFEMAQQFQDEALLQHFIDEGFRVDWPTQDTSPFKARILEYQGMVLRAKHLESQTPGATGGGDPRRL